MRTQGRCREGHGERPLRLLDAKEERRSFRTFPRPRPRHGQPARDVLLGRMSPRPPPRRGQPARDVLLGRVSPKAPTQRGLFAPDMCLNREPRREPSLTDQSHASNPRRPMPSHGFLWGGYDMAKNGGPHSWQRPPHVDRRGAPGRAMRVTTCVRTTASLSPQPPSVDPAQ